MSTQLLRNPTSIGDIFFSGSQSVVRGQAVIWVLTETWAFKATEAVGVSCNETPFVQMDAGQTFIIDQGAKYVFDNDTVVALAYPQEVTQDIIIENDIYNDNKNIITIEADQVPYASAGSNQTVTVNNSITFNGVASAVDPATVASTEWFKNGALVATSLKYTHTPTSVGNYDLSFVVTDSNGRKAVDTAVMYVEAYEAPPPTVFSDGSQAEYQIPEGVWSEIFKTTSIVNLGSVSCDMNYSAGFGFAKLSSSQGGDYSPSSASIRLRVGGTTVYTGTIYPSTITSVWTPALKVDASTFNATINNGTTMTMEVYWTSTNSFKELTSAGSAENGALQIEATQLQ